MARKICVKRPGLRDGPHPDDRRRRRRSATSSSASIGSPRSTSRSSTVVDRAARAPRPQEIETEITDKIEEAVNTISGIDELHSISTEGVSQVDRQVQLEKNVDVAAQEVRDQVSTALAEPARGDETRSSPSSTPTRRRSCSSRCCRSARSATSPSSPTTRSAAALENVHGVGQVTILGGRKRQIHVLLDPVEAARGRAERGRRAARHRGPEPHHAGRRGRHRPRAADRSA